MNKALKLARKRIKAFYEEEHGNLRKAMSPSERLQWEEGKSLTAYLDTTGNVTIGYGTNLARLELPGGKTAVPPNIKLIPVSAITDDIAVMLMDRKLKEVTANLASALPWGPKLDATRWSVLIDMAYNMGWRGLVNGWPNFLENVRLGQYDSAAEKMRKSKWYDDVHARRADPLIAMMRTGRE